MFKAIAPKLGFKPRTVDEPQILCSLDLGLTNPKPIWAEPNSTQMKMLRLRMEQPWPARFWDEIGSHGAPSPVLTQWWEGNILSVHEKKHIVVWGRPWPDLHVSESPRLSLASESAEIPASLPLACWGWKMAGTWFCSIQPHVTPAMPFPAAAFLTPPPSSKWAIPSSSPCSLVRF